METAWFDVIERICVYSSLGTLNSLLRTCTRVAALKVMPQRYHIQSELSSGVLAVHRVLKNGVLDGASTFTSPRQALTVMFNRGVPVRWALSRVGVSAGHPFLITGIPNTRAHLAAITPLEQKHIMYWQYTSKIHIDAPPLTGHVYVIKQAPGGHTVERAGNVAAHRVFDDNLQFDLIGLTAWMTDIVTNMQATLGAPGPVSSAYEAATSILRDHPSALTRQVV